jgi:hypothetical protein
MLSAPAPEWLGNFYDLEFDLLSNQEIPVGFTLKSVSFRDNKEKIFFLYEAEYESEFEVPLEELCRQFRDADAVVDELKQENQIMFGTVKIQKHPNEEPQTYTVFRSGMNKRVYFRDSRMNDHNSV